MDTEKQVRAPRKPVLRGIDVESAAIALSRALGNPGQRRIARTLSIIRTHYTSPKKRTLTVSIVGDARTLEREFERGAKPLHPPLDPSHRRSHP